MNQERPPDEGSLPLSGDLHVDEACLRFEAACKAGLRPRIEDYRGHAEGAESAALLQELILLDIAYRRQRGETAQSAGYLVRFPKVDSAWLDRVIAPSPPADEAPAPLAPKTVRELRPSQSAQANGGPAVRIAGYEVLRELGRGGMGVVYQARHLRLDRVVALKMILAGGHAGEAELARFRTEAEAVARLQHPNIVQIFEVGEHADLPYFSLEFCGGGGLDKKLNGAPLPPRAAAALLEKLARAMQAAHDKGVVHRDLKPANVLLAEGGEPKITDFGLAKKLDADAQTQTGAVMGTPSYMAPEQAAGKTKELGPACDVYALGAILYECLTGRPPFKGSTMLDTLAQVLADDPVPPRKLQSNAPRDLETICLKCLEKEPARRYGSALALAEDLERWLNGKPVTAHPPSWRYVLGKSLRRHKRFIVACAGALIGAVLLYAALADSGLEVPGGENVRSSLDHFGVSVFRPLPKDRDVRQAAAAYRRNLFSVLKQAQSPDGWEQPFLDRHKVVSKDVWTHSQTTFALLNTPDASNEELREVVPGLDLPFVDRPPIEVDGVKYGWLLRDPDDTTSAEPALWTAAALAAALARPGLLEGEARRSAQKHLAYTQETLETYRSREMGAWNMYPNQKDASQYSSYTTALALLALLETRRAGLPWQGTVERRDTLLLAAAKQLADAYDGQADPPGWRAGYDIDKTQEGLTLQISALLLRAEAEAGFKVPDRILNDIPSHLTLCSRRNLDFADDVGKFSIPFKDHKGQEIFGKESITFLWYPWAVECSARWLRRLNQQGASADEQIPVRRGLGRLVLDLGKDLRSKVHSEFTFVSAEDLICLAAIAPPD